jgi:hypothetical protein
VSGSQLLANSGGSDVALLRLNTTPPANYNVFYTGWDKTGTAPTSSTAIHHPSGDVKKISFDNNAATNGNFGGAQCWRILNWEDGTTEGGSSGSGLWNQNGLLVGQLFGGQASCSNNINDYYGKFNVSFPLLTQWLGNCGDQLQGFPQSVGVNEASVLERIQIAPNPTNGLFTVQLPANMAQGARITVFDALGQLVVDQNLTHGMERTTLDLSGRPEGLYFVSVFANGGKSVERLVLTR